MAAGRDAKSTRQNRFSSAGHGHSCQPTERHAPGAGGSGAPPSLPLAGLPGASPQWRVLRWLRDCLPTRGNKPHPKRLFKEQASGLVFKPLETLDKSLLCFYLHVNSQIGSFQKKNSTSSIIRLGYKDGACLPGSSPADPGYSKERRCRRGSGNNCLIKR